MTKNTSKKIKDAVSVDEYQQIIKKSLEKTVKKISKICEKLDDTEAQSAYDLKQSRRLYNKLEIIETIMHSMQDLLDLHNKED